MTMASAWRTAKATAATLAAAVGLMVSSLAAHAAIVNVVLTNFGGGGVINTSLNFR